MRGDDEESKDGKGGKGREGERWKDINQKRYLDGNGGTEKN